MSLVQIGNTENLHTVIKGSPNGSTFEIEAGTYGDNVHLHNRSDLTFTARGGIVELKPKNKKDGWMCESSTGLTWGEDFHTSHCYGISKINGVIPEGESPQFGHAGAWNFICCSDISLDKPVASASEIGIHLANNTNVYIRGAICYVMGQAGIRPKVGNVNVEIDGGYFAKCGVPGAKIFEELSCGIVVYRSDDVNIHDVVSEQNGENAFMIYQGTVPTPVHNLIVDNCLFLHNGTVVDWSANNRHNATIKFSNNRMRNLSDPDGFYMSSPAWKDPISGQKYGKLNYTFNDFCTYAQDLNSLSQGNTKFTGYIGLPTMSDIVLPTVEFDAD